GNLGDGTYDQRNTPTLIADAGIAWHVGTPRFGIPGGNYTTTLSVVIICETAGATIHYTTNGVDPTEADPTITSGSSVSITQSTTLKARAWKTGMPPSNVNTAVYTLTAVAPSLSPST